MNFPSLSVVVPTLGRPQRILEFTDNLFDCMDPDVDFELIWVVDIDDYASQDAGGPLPRVGCCMRLCSGTYPHKTNIGVLDAQKDMVLPGSDDMHFRPGWYEEIIKAFGDPAIQIVGTNDLTPKTAKGDHSCHPIVRRSYIEDPGASWDQKHLIFYEGYHHNFPETEIIAVARSRGAWAFAEKSIIEHHHPNWGTREMDATDRRGGQNNFHEDERLFKERSKQWK